MRLLCSLTLSLVMSAVSRPAYGQSLEYPATHRDTTVDNYFGVAIRDPYRWLERLQSQETAEWIAAENALTRGYLSELPQRDALRARLTELWNYPKLTLPVRSAGRLFYRKNTGLQRQSVLYVRPTRVVPSHSYKFTAALQAAQGCHRPALIRIETQGSHGYRPTDKQIAQAADLWAFAAANLELRVPARPVQP